MEKQFQIPVELRVITKLFYEAGEDVRIVGGAVRDLVMGVKPKDWDMATTALPEITMQILEKIGRPYDLSNGHGTISINLDGETYEITTLRKDVDTDGRHAKVEFVTDFQADAARRDFTINAMSINAVTEEIFDYFGGQLDVCNKLIRFVGKPAERIQEDYLRILRFFRFAARYNWHMAVDALIAIERNAEGLRQISGERIWMEVKQIMQYPNTDAFVQDMKNAGVWDVIMEARNA
jgi:tRNA nucleotidyltransferase/poly(A) polymerase